VLEGDVAARDQLERVRLLQQPRLGEVEREAECQVVRAALEGLELQLHVLEQARETARREVLAHAALELRSREVRARGVADQLGECGRGGRRLLGARRGCQRDQRREVLSDHDVACSANRSARALGARWIPFALALAPS